MNGGRHRRSLLSILVSGVFLSGCTGHFTDDLFEQHEVVIGSAKHQTVLSGFFLEGPIAELAVVSVDENDDRRVRIYGLGDGGWVPRLDATLRPEVLFVDCARISGRDRLITYESGRLYYFDPDSGSERPLVAVTCDFNPPPRGGVPHVDVTRDVNADDRDDLVVPDFDGFRVFIQMSDGGFAAPVKIGPSFEMSRIDGADGYRCEPWGSSRIHEMDYNRDGRGDLVFWNEDHFEVHLQDEQGLFAPATTTFTTEVAFDSDQLASLAAPHGVRRRRTDHDPTGDLTGRVLHSFTDMNGDGVADLAVFSLEGGSLWRMHSTYEVHFGTPTPDGHTAFASDISTAIRSDGIPFAMEHHDFDRDGQVDMMFTVIDPDFFKAVGMLISAVMTDSVSVDIEFYRMEGGIYPDRPDATRTTRAHSFGKSGDKASLFRSVLIGDVNGDGRSDLLVQRDREELRVFLGVPGPDLFARQPQRVAVAMPDDEQHTWLVSLNKDGKQDILMYHPSTEPRRVTMLIAR